MRSRVDFALISGRLSGSFISVFGLLSLLSFCVGYYYYSAQKEEILDAQKQQLTAIADLKAHEIRNWYDVQLGMAETIRQNRMLALSISDFLRHPAAGSRKNVADYLRSLVRDAGYESANLFDAFGKLSVSSGAYEHELGDSDGVRLRTAIKDKRVVFSDFHRNAPHEHAHLSFIAPLVDDQRAVGAILLEFNISHVDLAFGNSWPTPSPTAEALLVRSENDSVVYLNDVRQISNSTLTLKRSITDTTVPAVMAVRGKTGIVEGLDYREVMVLAALRRIPHTPWFLVAKVDMAEILEPVRERAWIVTVIAVLVISVLGTLLGLIWRHRRSEHYRRQLELEKEKNVLKKRFEYITKFANDAILLIDETGAIRESNERASDSYGYSYDELIRLNLTELVAKANGDLALINRTVGDKGLLFEATHRKKDGILFPVEISVREIVIDGQRYHQSIIRDISERRSSAEALRTSEERFRMAIEGAPFPIMIHAEDGQVLSISKAWTDLSGYTLKDIATVAEWTQRAFGGKSEEVRTHIQSLYPMNQRIDEGEFEITTSDGQQRIWEFSSTPLGSLSIGRRLVISMAKDVTDRKRTEEALRLGEERFRGIIEGSVAGYFRIGIDSRFQYVNGAWLRMHGYSSASEIVGKPFALTQVPADLHRVESLVEAVLHGEVIPDGEFSRKRRDGSVGFHSFSIQPIRQADAVVGLEGFLIDRTEQQLAQEESRLSDLRYQSLFQNMLDGYAYCKMIYEDGVPIDFAYIEVNDSFGRLTGLTDVAGKNVTEVIPGIRESAPEFLEIYGRVALTGIPERFEIRLDEINAWLAISVYSTEKEHFVAVFDNITERKLSEAALRESESRFRSVTQSASDAIISADENSLITLWNSGASRIFGYTESEVLGKPLAMLIPDRYRDAHHRGIVRMITSGEPHVIGKTIELAGLRKGGNEFPLELSLNSWTGEGKTFFSAIIRDVTDRTRFDVAIRASEVRFRSVWERSVNGMRLTDSVGRIIDVNDEYCRLVSKPREELIGFMFSTTYKEQGSGEEMEVYRRRFATEEIVQRLTPHIQLWNDEELDVEIDNSFIRSMDGEKMLLSIFRDITKRKQAEEQLAQERNLLRTILDAIPDEILVKDSFRRIVLVNPGTIRAFGKTSDAELLGKTDDDLVPAHCIEASRLEEEGILTGDHPSVHGVGDKLDPVTGEIVRSLMISKTPLKNAAGDIIGLVVANHDITELKQAKDLLEKERTRLRTLIENIPDEVCLKDLDHRFLVANSAYLKTLNADSLDDLIGKTISNFVSWEQAQEHLAEERTVIETGRSLIDNEKNVVDPKTGQMVACFLVTTVPVRDHAGKMIGILVVNRNITQRKRAEAALAASEERFRTLFEESKDVIYVSTADGKLVDVNAAGVELFGYSSKEEMLQIDIVHNHNHTSQREDFQERMRAHGFVQDFEEVFKTKTGESITVLETATAVHDKQGSVVMYRGILRDVTRQRKLERGMLNTQRLESLGVLAGGVAHDFNNLLQAILGNTSMAMKRLKPEHPAYSNVEKAERAAERARLITRQLLAYSGRGKFEVKPLDLNALICDNIQLLGATIPKNVRLVNDFSSDPRMIDGDPGQIQQVVMNIIINGAESVPTSGGSVTCKVWTQEILNVDASEWIAFDESSVPGQFVMLEIRDDGCGMSPETLKSIFDPFFTTKFTGRGLGLPAVLGIVRGHHGGLNVKSHLGEGTTFQLAFPASYATVERDVIQSTEPVAQSSKGYILVIDDEEAIRDVLADILEDNGIKPLLAADGESGIEVYRNNQSEIDFVMLDLSMPGLSGEETCMRLMEINSAVRVVITSGFAEEEVVEKFVGIKTAGFIQKPYRWDQFIQTISKFMSHQEVK